MKMILIITEEGDVSTKRVCNWLLYNKVPFVVINEVDLLLGLSLSISNNCTDFFADFQNGKKFNLSDITTYWYRRGRIERKPPKLLFETNRFIKEMHLYSEWQRLQLLLHILIEKKSGIGNFEGSAFFNKLHQLTLAAEVGLNIPKTIVSNYTSDLSCFVKSNNICITKSLERDLRINGNRLEAWTNGTNMVNMENILALGDSPQYPSLIQEGIEKKYELRAFYLDGKLWTMCIFHNCNDDTIDYRLSKLPLRMAPYKLPKEIEEKICRLMILLKWNTGSLDILVGKNCEYYFLEVNPIGQYEFVSAICNYPLDMEICNYLIRQHLENGK